MSARETALCALLACRVNGAYINEAVKELSARDRLEPRDAALAARLCYGVVQSRLRLDFYLAQLYRGKHLHPMVRDILHMGLYQLYDMDRIPVSAAVHEAVALTKKYCPQQPKAPGLVNALLRAADRERNTLAQPTSYEEKYSYPPALVAALKRAVPKGMLESVLAAGNAAPPVTVQVNTLRIGTDELVKRLESEGVRAKRHAWCPDCLTLENTGAVERLPSFREGLYYVQDAAARASVLCAGLPAEGGSVLDCCAAPGGKSFAAALAMGGKGQILACDIYEHKRALIEVGARRMGFSHITVALCDGTVYQSAWDARFDAVIADVPCSGLGIIRKKPDIRYKDPASFAELPALQGKLLANAARYVRPGGVLLYSTCTLLPEENEGVVRAFLAEHAEFAPQALAFPVPGAAPNSASVTLLPGQQDTDGFYICRLRRAETTEKKQ